MWLDTPCGRIAAITPSSVPMQTASTSAETTSITVTGR